MGKRGKSLKLKKRPDEIVIPNDILELVGRKRFVDDLGGKLENDSIEKSCEHNIEKRIEQAKKYIGIKREIMNPQKHQLVADSISACVIIGLVGGNNPRQDALRGIVKGAKGSARTNYQFVRNFIRRNIAGLLEAKSHSLAQFNELFPPNVREELRKGYAKRIIEKTKLFLKEEWPAIAIQIGTSAAGGAITLRLKAWLSKGEFTHFEEVFPALAALENKDHNVKIGIMVGKPSRYRKIARDIRKKAPTMALSHLKTKVFRYYIFPTEYLLMIAGRLGQFLVFWGSTNRQKLNITKLLKEDWTKAWEKGTIAISEE